MQEMHFSDKTMRGSDTKVSVCTMKNKLLTASLKGSSCSPVLNPTFLVLTLAIINYQLISCKFFQLNAQLAQVPAIYTPTRVRVHTTLLSNDNDAL